MPYKDKEKSRERERKRWLERPRYLAKEANQWRQRMKDKQRCSRCGTPLLEGEGICCVNCSSKTIRNLMAIARRNV